MNESGPIDVATLDALRLALGPDFARQLGFFREDGAKSLVAIEEAVRARSAIAMVRPAYSLGEDASEFGAVRLAALVARIEAAARGGVADGTFPLEAVEDVLKLRSTFNAALAALMAETSTASAILRAVGLGRLASRRDP